MSMAFHSQYYTYKKIWPNIYVGNGCQREHLTQCKKVHCRQGSINFKNVNNNMTYLLIYYLYINNYIQITEFILSHSGPDVYVLIYSSHA